MRLRLALSGLLAFAPVVVAAPASAAPCSTATRTISGTLLGEDGRYVDAMLGFDLIQVVGTERRHIDGRAGSSTYGCAGYHGYGQVLRVNSNVPATGSTTTGSKTWSVTIPAIVNDVIIEVYPRAAGTGPVDESRYGHALRWKVPIPYGKAINIRLPLVCAQGGSTGWIGGYTTVNGVRKKMDRVAAWSMAKDNNTASPIQGFKVGYSLDSGSFAIKNLAGNQYYTVVYSLGTRKVQKYNVYVHGCKGTTSTGSF
jgi:hypothetical protein